LRSVSSLAGCGHVDWSTKRKEIYSLKRTLVTIEMKSLGAKRRLLRDLREQFTIVEVSNNKYWLFSKDASVPIGLIKEHPTVQ
jgi:hypothetical protein